VSLEGLVEQNVDQNMLTGVTCAAAAAAVHDDYSTEAYL
jgi:hypothetical protein